MALKIERVVDGGVDAEEALRRPGRLEPLYLALSPAHGLMGILNPVVLSLALLMTAGQAELPDRRPVGTQLVGNQQFRREALLPEQLAHQPERRTFVASPLNQHVEDLALMVNRAPQVHRPASDPDDHLVEMPAVARAGAALP